MGKIADDRKLTRKRALALVEDYLSRAGELLQQLSQQYPGKPLLASVRGQVIPQSGKVGDVSFRFHGIGVRFESPEGVIVDCEIGKNEEPAGFDAWRLAMFAGESLGGSQNERVELIEVALNKLAESHFIERLDASIHSHLYKLSA